MTDSSISGAFPGASDETPLASRRVADLQTLAASLGIRGAARLRKHDLVATIERTLAEQAADAAAAPVVEELPAAEPATEPAAAPDTQEAPEFAATPSPDTAPADTVPADTVSADTVPAAEAAVPTPVAEPTVQQDEPEPETIGRSGADVQHETQPQSERPARSQNPRRSRRVQQPAAPTAASSELDPISAAVFPAPAAAPAPLTLDDLVLPPARGEVEEEPQHGRRRRRVAVAAGAPELVDEETAETDGDSETDAGEESGAEGERGARRRGRGRGRRSRGAEQGAESAEPEEESTETEVQDAEDDSAEEQNGARRGRGRGRGRSQGGNGNGQPVAEASTEQDDEDSRRGRGRYRDRKRGRSGDDVDPEYSPDDVLLPIAGILDVLDNYAFVRTSGYLPGPNDVYVSLGQVKKYGLRKGDAIVGAVRQPREGEAQHGRQKFNAIVRFDTINGQAPEDNGDRPVFEELTALYPEERLRLETSAGKLTPRIIDLFAPIGKGTRGLIIAPPKAGKSVVLQQIAAAIAENSPATHLIFVLVDERPEEVTSLRRSINGEVVASTFDLPAEDHTTIAELAIERAKRLVELGHDVVVLLDSITALSRAYNLSAPASGRVLAGGVDAAALYPPKRFFGAARKVENGGSLTILATALVDTGSHADEVILEEFVGKGNTELRLSREIADQRIFPALDLRGSQTTQEEQLLTPEEVEVTWAIRRELARDETQHALEAVLDRLAQAPSNAEFLASVRRQPIVAQAPRR